MALRKCEVTLEIHWDDYADVDWGPVDPPDKWDWIDLLDMNTVRNEDIVVKEFKDI